jgi:FlaA1/EpsC-like NDP-sugar epimerase
MVARTAYTQLRYSKSLLIVCTLLLLVSYVVPFAALFNTSSTATTLGIVAIATMLGTYTPTIRYYELSPVWVFTLPLAAILFLAMTWTSAIRYSRGERSRWKNRSYARAIDTNE